MATQNQGVDLTFLAAGDLSSHQFKFMKISADRTVTICNGATDKPVGVLQNKPNAANREAVVRVYGSTKVKAGGTITAGTHFNIGTDASGLAVAYAPGTDTTKYMVGQPITGGASGEIIEALIDCTNAARGA